MDASYPELEIGLHRVQSEVYQLDLRLLDPASAGERAPLRAPCALDPRALLPLEQAPVDYGRTLASQLFSDPESLGFLRLARAVVESGDRSLRLRLVIGPTAAELDALRWELLCDPDSGMPFATSERLLLSRFMPSQDWRPIRLRPKAALRALVAVSAPVGLPEYGLAPLDAAAEVARARDALTGIEVTALGENEPLTLDALQDALRGGTDILYLVAHGSLDRSQGPVLWLQGQDGGVHRIAGADLAQRIEELREPPRLAVLASCESAAVTDSHAVAATPGRPSPQAALAPRLAAAGVPAVLAMQGRISLETAATLMPCFFRELLKDGQLDRALAVARGLVRGRPDAWMPALFLRLKGGRLWYEPGFGANGIGSHAAATNDAVKWAALVSDIEKLRFTPIVGWGLAEGLYGGTADLAERLAKANRFPLAPYQCMDLPQVSQYLGVAQRSTSYPLDEFKRQLREQVLTRHRDLLTPEDQDASLARLVRKVAALRRQAPRDPYRLLAALPATVFIDATPDGLLAEALREAGKEPDERCIVWRRDQEPPAPYAGEPSVARPLIYQILGRFKDPESLVLTQDDHFDFLIGASRDKALIPNVVRHALTGRPLLFLGFQLADWSFRVLFRLIMSQDGRAQGRNLRFPHAAVQLDPEGSALLDPVEARRYLMDAYGGDAISLYWGSADDFLRDLAPRLPARTPAQWDRDAGVDDDY
jgi:hypothetical protein